MTTFDKLPKDIIINIMNHANDIDKLSVSQTCKRLSIVMKDETIKIRNRYINQLKSLYHYISQFNDMSIGKEDHIIGLCLNCDKFREYYIKEHAIICWHTHLDINNYKVNYILCNECRHIKHLFKICQNCEQTECHNHSKRWILSKDKYYCDKYCFKFSMRKQKLWTQEMNEYYQCSDSDDEENDE